MALTTQCPNCQTRFRVVNDQLKLRGGLVRCGACQIVFNAREHLIDADADAAAPASPAPEAPFPFAHIDLELPSRSEEPAPGADASVPPPEEEALPSSAPSAPAEHVDVEAVTAVESIDAGADADTDAEAEAHTDAADTDDSSEPAADSADDAAPLDDDGATVKDDGDAAPAQDTEAEAGATAAEDAAADDNLQAEAETESATAAGTAETTEPAEPESTGWIDGDEPGFLRRARRAQRIARISRVVMSVGSLLLLAGAAVQGLHSFGSRIAGTLPATRPYLEEACALLDCRIGLPIQADAVAIESSELQLVPEQQSQLALSVLLRNHGSSTLAWPNLELSLLDNQGKPLVRKILQPADYLPQPKDSVKGFTAGAEQALRVTLEVGTLAPTDYRVYLFYP